MYDTIQRTIAAWAFNHYVAYYYFDNVNVSQLKVAFEKGEVELENLPIKKDALKHLNVPMEVVSGIVGNLSIKVPLLTLLTDPWVIKIKNLMLIVAPPKPTVDTDSINSNKSATDAATESFVSNMSDQSRIELTQEAIDQNLNDSFGENSNLDYENEDSSVTSEETKLAEFYSSFSSTMSSIVKDIYKNIKLEIESMTILFEEFDHGVVKLNVDNLLLHRPKSIRNLSMDNVSIYLSAVGVPGMGKGDDLLKINVEKCNIDIYDEASNNMQLVVVRPEHESGSTSNYTPPTTTSETKFDCNLVDVSIEQLFRTGRRCASSEKQYDSKLSSENGKNKDSVAVSKRDIIKSDKVRIEFKLNHNIDDESIKSPEKNLHIKLDLFGMQYIHSQKIYEITTQRLTNLLKFFIKIRSKKPSNQNNSADNKDLIRKREETSNKLLNINIKEGLIYVVDDTSGSCAIPLLEFTLEDCAIYHISGKFQQDGFVFAKIGCNYFNREVSTWAPLLQPWPFNLNWRIESLTKSGNRYRRFKHRKIELTSDEMANFVLSSAFLDLGDVALKRMIDDIINPKLWPLSTSLCLSNEGLAHDFNSIFVIHNETGHKLHFAPLEQNNELYEVHDSSTSSGNGTSTPLHKLSTHSKSSTGSRDSPDLSCLARWISVDVGETLSFEFSTLPVYRRHNSDMSAQSRILLIRVEGWKTLVPVAIDKTGVFFREACSDRVMNEDTYIVVSIDLEEKSARKIISIRSPLNLVNLLDATLEVHFVESKQALYIKPESHLAVPLPYLFDKIHIRPCNVGVTMSEEALLWDEIQQIINHESRIHICHPITVTKKQHASYCTSQPYRVCISINHDGPKYDDSNLDFVPYFRIPVYSMSFIPPLTIVNLLPCKLQYFIGEIEGLLSTGSQQKIYHVDTTKTTHVNFKMNGFPQSKPINIDPGATGSFHHTLEMFDKKNRSLFLNAKIILASQGEEPAVQVIIYSPFWLINKTKLPLIFKQEGAALEAAGQFREHEESVTSILLFSFYDIEMEPPWLCSMRLGKSKGTSMWCDGFKLEKGAGERKLCFIPARGGDSRMNKSLIDINIRRGFGRYSDTMIVTFTARYGFDPLDKTPKKATESSPQNYKLTSYNHNTNLAERIAGQAVSLFNNNNHKGTSEIKLKVPGLKLTLVDNCNEKFIEASAKDILVSCTTRAKEQLLDCSIQDVRIDNVLPDCEKGITLDRATDMSDSINMKPAIRLIMDRILGNSFGTTLFRQVQLSMCELVLNIEEKLVLKLVEFMSFRNRRKKKNMNNLTHDLDKILHPEDDRMSKYYFDLLRIDLSSLKLSVFTTTNLTNSLQKLKSYLDLKFFGFEDAQVQLSPYFKMNVSRTFKDVFESVTRFYRRQILEQAPRIVGQQIQNYLRFHLSDLLSSLYDEIYNKLILQ